MKILQKLKFMFARHSDTPTEARPDDMTSKKEHGTCSVDGACCEKPVGEKNDEGCCDHGCDCK